MNLKTVKILTLLSFVLILGVAIACIKRVIPIPPPPPASTTLKNGLLLYLPFNGSIADSSGNNNPTVIIDSAGGYALTTDEHGDPNSAWGSNGTGTYIQVTNNGSIKIDTAFSLSFNVMAYNNTERQAFVCFDNTANGNSPGIATGLTVPNYTNYFVGVQDSTAGCGNPGSYVTDVSDTTGFVPQSGVWYNIVNVYQQGTVWIYVNGQLMGSKTNPLNHAVLDCPLSTINIGYWWNLDNESLNGKIDEIRLYNRTLTVDEISALANKL
jgi:Concanavalin A-like lectin/glucanases superfamily